MEHRQLFLSSPGSSAPQNAGRSAQITESQGDLRVEVTVIRAHNVPRIKKRFGTKRQFFVTVADGTTVKETRSARIDGRTAQWDQTLDAFFPQRSSHLILCLYRKRSAHPDILIGACEISIPVESQSDVPVVLSNGDGDAGQWAQPVTLYLTITVSGNVTSSALPNDPPIIPTKGDDSSAEEGTTSSIVSDPGGPIPSTSRGPLSDPLLVETGAPIPGGQVEISPTEEVPVTLRADEAENQVNVWIGATGRIERVMDAVSPIAELHPYARMAYGLISAIPKTLLEQYQRDDNVLSLLEAVHDAFDFAQHEDTLKSIKLNSRQAEILTLMLQHVCNCCDFILSYAKESQFWKRVLTNMGGGVQSQIQDLSIALVQHRRAFLDKATTTIEITAFQILDGVGILSAKVDGMSTQLKWVSRQVPDAELDARVREIPYGIGSRFIPEKGSLIGARIAFLDFIVEWVNDPASERGLVLFGKAGTGKSSIVHEIACRFDKMHRLTSSFIFSRKEQSKREVYHLFTTLARDLSDRYPSFKTALGRVVKDNSSLRTGTRDYDTLFESLILEPLKGLHIVGPIFVVIDALDESGGATGRIGLHTFLAKNLVRLPSNFRVFITSRPEDDIVSALAGAQSVRIKFMDNTELAAILRDKILTYLQKRLPPEEFRKYGEALTWKSEGLFQWAAVACGYILNPPASFGFSKKKCIEHLLRPTADSYRQDPLNELYKEVLEGYFTHQEARILFRSVIGQLITTFEPLSIRSLTTLRYHASNNDDHDSVAEILRHLGSLLSNVDSADQNLPVVPLHTSFRDFLTNEEKSGDFCVHLHDAHGQLARSCLGLLINDLKFNICNFESSYLANKDIKDLGSRVDKHIPPALLYACRFWGDHLEHINFETGLFVQLRTFFEERFLFWLEALSLTSSLGLALPVLSALDVWLASGQGQVLQIDLEESRSFVKDASLFVRHFGMAMGKSAPHIYLSALPFAPTGSLISTRYSRLFPRIIRMERGRISHWPSLEMVISNVGSEVRSITLSPDGRRIVSGSEDGTIHMWNATTGECVTGPLTGHTSRVPSVAFSPDGQLIVSCSFDRTIRVWHATTGEKAAGPFIGHASQVTSVAFSPDGRLVVSGSLDRTIRVWDIATGETVLDPFTASGRTSRVTSVAFSPDGQLIVSGHFDHTVRMWNVTTGEKVAGPFSGHTSRVMSVALSPDGQLVVSSSGDQTIRVWHATTGEKAAGPFTGHTSRVTSVAFSPDGQHVVSGSDDQTIRVWHATTGEKVAGPFTGHTSWVTSVAFSPDGQRIISGSLDRTIRMWNPWNATTGETTANPFYGHTSCVISVAFSSDGQRIVSGSQDRSIRVWDVTTGRTVAGPFTGHTDCVRSVAFSPDGERVVSGSNDRTIRVWNVEMGQIMAGPFIGHTNWVRSVAFSLDGKRVVSSSDDRTIRVWDAETGATVAGPCTGHTSLVLSVAFSPDGQLVVSGSHDRTIRVWDVTTGRTVAGPFTGHTSSVECVAFSPDGQRIASGSWDRNIYVWNATTGETVAGPFNGHTNWVSSVAFSPDGRRIVSGSQDRTVRVWNAATGETVIGPFTGHTNWVRSVAFSPDGQHVVSGSDDHTIRLWNVTTAEAVEGAFGGLNATIEPKETIRHVDFTNDYIINDEGWICGSKGELLMWIPPLHRVHLHRPSNIWVAGRYETRVDLSTFVHGPSWTTCIINT